MMLAYTAVALAAWLPPAQTPAGGEVWASERYHVAANAQLELLTALLARDASPDGDELASLFAEGFTATPPRPGEPMESLHRGLAVRRYAATAFADPALEPMRAPSAFFEQLLAPLAEMSERRFELEVIALRPGPEGRFESEALFQAAGRTGSVVRQLDARLALSWVLDVEVGPPRIAFVGVRELTDVAADEPLYTERTRAVLGAAGGASELLGAGCEDWYARIDRLGELNFWGHNGIAVADVNGDGLDDLYVAMGTGVPNMLFVQNSDGSATERALEAGCAWLDDTKGVLLADFDNDGDADLLCAIGPTLVLSENDGAGNFTPARSLRAATNASFYSLAAADYDVDGDLDVYAVRYVKTTYTDSIPIPYHDARNGPRNHLLRNDGTRFVDVTDLVGLDAANDRFSLAAAWSDYDGDGDPDLYVANDFGENNLYRNDGERFVDVAAEAGVLDPAAGMGVSFADVDLDGHEDLLVSNMFTSDGQRISAQPEFKPGDEELRRRIRYAALGNSLFRNRGDGTFEDRSDAAGIRLGRWSWGALFTDIDADGLPDMVVPNGFLTNEKSDDLCAYFWQRVAPLSPGGEAEVPAYRAGWADVSARMDAGASWNGNERNCAYLNLGDGSFANVSAVAGVDFPDDARALALVDWDGDGAVDLWLKNRTSPALRFLKNELAVGARWVALRLVGSACNRDAVGARVELEAGGRRYVRERRLGDGYLAQSSAWLYFGLGADEEIESCVVRWPGGGEERIEGLRPGARFRVVQGAGKVEELPARAVTLGPEGADWKPLPASARVVLRTPLPLPPELRGALYGGREGGRARLVTTWSLGCAPCIAQLEALAERSDELHHLGLDVVAVNEDAPAAREAADATFAVQVQPRMGGSSFASMRLEAGPRAVLRVLLKDVIGPRADEAGLLTSVLVDANDMIAVVYLGPVEIDTLVEDSIRFGLNAQQAGVRAGFEGRWFFGMPRNLEALAKVLEAAGERSSASFYRALLQLQQRR